MTLVAEINRNSHGSRVASKPRRGPKVVEATVKAALVAVLFSVSILLPLAAQQTAPASPQPVQLLRGALAALSANTIPRDVTLSGTAHYIAGSTEETGTATLKATAGGASRVDLNLSSGPRSEINNSASNAPAGKWSGPDGVSHDISIHNLLTEPAWFFPTFLVLRGLSPSGYAVAHVGHETRDGEAVEHLTISQASVPQLPPTLAHLAQTDLFLDATTLLPVALAFNIHPDDNALLDIPIEIRFSDYRPINGVQGVQVPFHIQKFLNNGLVLDLQLENATFNSGLSASEFAVQ